MLYVGCVNIFLFMFKYQAMEIRGPERQLQAKIYPVTAKKEKNEQNTILLIINNQ